MRYTSYHTNYEIRRSAKCWWAYRCAITHRIHRYNYLATVCENTMRCDRLQALHDHLVAMKPDDPTWDFSFVARLRDDKNTCGCAIHALATVDPVNCSIQQARNHRGKFVKGVDMVIEGRVINEMLDDDYNYATICAAEYFDIPQHIARGIFFNVVTYFGLRNIIDRVTPQMVAAEIKDLLDKHKERV